MTLPVLGVRHPFEQALPLVERYLDLTAVPDPAPTPGRVHG
ncbi:hypothetical protein [Streptomyces albidocamelliae]|uniref:Uncharacterized protein n=1 Tax=Streptomyces albidocamelliae TaxID=2981135 RepID=A0ABY6EQG1_9ACTN|nr:hypothetical protein [Streptomyces sp. HUAS 14-6]UXY36633.1 hypothetical protein N8I86_19030 [Streptomyces sp. HUAS 14-6]